MNGSPTGQKGKNMICKEWTAVKEQPPKKNENVLCFFPEKNYGSKIAIDYAETDTGFFARSHKWGQPSHWMPLPALPGKEG